MPKTILRCACRWVPIEKSSAQRLGLTVAPFQPTHRASEFGLIPDTSVWMEANLLEPNLPSHLPPRWRVALRLASQDGMPVVSEVRIFPNEAGQGFTHEPGEWSGTYGARRKRIPSGGLTARLLQKISLRIFRRDLHTIRTRNKPITWVDVNEKTKVREQRQGREDVAKLFRQLARVDPSFPLDGPPMRPIRRRSSGLSDRELLRVARVYERASLAGRPVTEAVAKALNLKPSKTRASKARDAISRARYLGFLTKTKRGISGGALTEDAQTLLNVKTHKGGTRHGTKR